GQLAEMVHHRRLPMVGGGTGVWSFVHIEDAVRATVAAVDADVMGAYNIVDDDPALVSQWLPLLARLVAAKPPRPVPGPLAQVLLGEYGVSLMTQVRGSSNAKARHELWEPTYRSWRHGFPEVFA